MGLISLFRSIYNVGTLDTRFTTPSSVPYKTTIDTRNDESGSRDRGIKPDPRAQPPMWNTLEFYFYYLIISGVVVSMFWIASGVSNPSDPRYPDFKQHLSPGWVPGRMIDVSDPQYHTFRENLLYLGLLLLLHPLLRKAWNAVHPLPKTSASHASPEVADTRLAQRVSFDYVFALIFLVALHGISALKILVILWMNYNLAMGLPRKWVPAGTWIFNISILFANELCTGYHLKGFAEMISGPQLNSISRSDGLLIEWASWLDSWGGLMARWEILFNITVLRLISFNLDYYWSLDRRSASPIEKKQLDPANLSERDRVSIPAKPKDFSFRNYLAYAIYAPLYLTGPIMTFNDYISQLRYRPATIERPRTLLYAVRFLLALLAMELVLHYVYVGAISKADPDWSTYTAAQLSMLSYFNLHVIWLKLLLPWRLSRLWALVDGVDPPENMLRCVSDNYSTLAFWRAWHRSYYRWTLRYIFIPLGGASFRSWRAACRSIVTYLAVFTFVAMWHDIQLRLLIWGWLIVLFFIPEVLASYLFPKRRWEAQPTAYRLLCSLGAVGNILMMMAANLVGFAVGLDGLETIVSGIFREWSGALFLVLACTALFVGSQVMFEIREAEMRRGIFLKC